MKSSRHTYMDVLRILAIYLVLLNHLPANRIYMRESGMAEVAALAFAVFVKINVPTFAMISGALLLGKEENVRTLWSKRIARFLLVIPVFSMLLYICFWRLRHRAFNLTELFYGIFEGNLKDFTSYWFLYAYLGFLLVLPFLRHIAKAMTKGEFILLLSLNLLLTAGFPLLNFGLQHFDLQPIVLSKSINTSLATAVLLFYPLIGYYLDKKIDVSQISQDKWIKLLAACVTGSAITAAVAYTSGKESGFHEQYIALFNVINVITIFLVSKRFFNTGFNEKHPKIVRLLSVIAPLVFGVYLLDPCFKLLVYEPLKAATWHTLHPFGFSILCATLSFACCAAITYLLRLIPFFQKML